MKPKTPPRNYVPLAPDIYVPSKFGEIEVDKQMVKVEVRALQKDKGYFTVNINGKFIGHIRKMGDKWIDFLGKDQELYQIVGIFIERQETK